MKELRSSGVSLKSRLRSAINRLGYDCSRIKPEHAFHSNHTLRLTARMLEHLATLRLPLANRTVLEVGAGIGDYSTYFLDRGCQVTITDIREENLTYLRARFPAGNVQRLDLEAPIPLDDAPFDIVLCYGVLYHLSNPANALAYLAKNCKEILLLSTVVSFDNEATLTLVREDRTKFSQAFHGVGCIPARRWVFNQLQAHFPYVYVPTTQPNHEQFPLNWADPLDHAGLTRAIFIGSRQSLANELLSTTLIDRYNHHR